MPQFDTAYFLSQIFWMTFSFFCLYLGVAFIVFPLFHAIFDKRKKWIELPLEQAEDFVQKTQALQTKIDEKETHFKNHLEEQKNHLYESEKTKMNEAIEKTQTVLSKSFKKAVQKMEKEEKYIHERSNDFVSNLVKGSR